ncbi:MAG: 2-oxoacid:acceptor oxidoreductase family protein, partial [Deltaproteobacteria bacterium]|nr:2-oxoacid:acceptor oxidoreductase family protein [Deltaproteobacteria bacterium]
DIMLAMSQKACDEYVFDLKNGGTLIVDSTYISQIPTSNALAIPISARTREHFGREIFSNIVALGVLCEATGIVSSKAMLVAIGHRVPRGTEKINTEAFNFGRELAKKFRRNPSKIDHDTVKADS